MRKVQFIVMLLCVLTFASCESQVDGDIKLKWEANVKMTREGYYKVIKVPKEGAEITLTCKNQSYFFLAQLWIDGVEILTDNEKKEKHLTYGGFDAITEKNVVYVKIQPNTCCRGREFTLDVSTCMTASLFKFLQE